MPRLGCGQTESYYLTPPARSVNYLYLTPPTRSVNYLSLTLPTRLVYDLYPRTHLPDQCIISASHPPARSVNYLYLTPTRRFYRVYCLIYYCLTHGSLWTVHVYMLYMLCIPCILCILCIVYILYILYTHTVYVSLNDLVFRF